MSTVSARVVVLNETKQKVVDGKWRLCLQWCLYSYSDGTQEYGFRYIWRKGDGKLQAARGQARIPSLKIAKELMDEAIADGWGNNEDPDLKIGTKNNNK